MFGRDIADSCAYDLVLNTGSLPCEAAAHLVESAALEKFAQLRLHSEPLVEMRAQW